MSWLIIIAGLFEVSWAIGLKYTAGFTKLWPAVGTLIAMVASVVLLGVAMQTLPVGTAYAVWLGIGAVASLLGILLFGESTAVLKLISLCLIFAGIIGLKLAHG